MTMKVEARFTEESVCLPMAGILGYFVGSGRASRHASDIIVHGEELFRDKLQQNDDLLRRSELPL